MDLRVEGFWSHRNECTAEVSLLIKAVHATYSKIVLFVASVLNLRIASSWTLNFQGNNAAGGILMG